MSRNTSKKISIVILGGGGAGAALAYRLATSPQLPSSRYDLTLVNDRPFQQHLLAGPRASVTDEGNLEDWGLIPYDTIFGAGKTGSFKQGTAENVDLDNRIIKLVGGEQLRYDYLVLATGSKWEGPLDLPIGTKNEAIGFIKEWRRKVSSASQVCVVGGGAVGIGQSARLC
jgi:NADH dehydrogenase FAD-containing subunit